VYGGTRTRRFEEFGAWQRTKSEAKLNINWKIGRRLGVSGYGSRIQGFDMEMVFLTTLQLAKRLGIAPITLQIWRSQGIGIPFVKQGTRVFYRLADVQDYERRNVDSLSAWLLGSDRPLPEMEALVRAANLPLQKIRQRIGETRETTRI
jgi:DNA-binding transcriptional MerR regulator